MNKTIIKIGDKFPTNEGGVAEVVEYVEWNEVYIKFEDYNQTGYVKKVQANNLRDGRCKNPYYKSRLNIGYLGVGVYKSRLNGNYTKEYKLWQNILARCYNPNHNRSHRYGGRGVTVCDEWHNFQIFAEWCNQQPHFGEEGFQLDKDLMVKDAKNYSPNTCSFIPHKINSLLISSNKRRGVLPVGVCRYRGKYLAQCKNDSSKHKSLGVYNTPEEAFQVYKNYKENYIKEVAQEEYSLGNINSAVYNTLMNWVVVPYPE